LNLKLDSSNTCQIYGGYQGLESIV